MMSRRKNKQIGPGYCTDCPKREGCIELCPEAEAYVNQDYAPPFECQMCEDKDYCTQEYMESGNCWKQFRGLFDEISERYGNIATIDNLQAILIMYFREHKKISEIAKSLKISHQYVSFTVKRYLKVIRRNLSN
jgi:hypothetical protein